MEQKTALVITSISAPNPALKAYARGCKEHDFDFIVIGDVSSPSDFILEDCDYWGIERQRGFSSRLALALPERHYARKNIGYLVAMSRGANTIIETDDDNFPYESFWINRLQKQRSCLIENSGWINVYRFFTDAMIWPRGFPLEYIQQSSDTVLPSRKQATYCPIQQGLADENPDVDAIYRLIMPLPQKFSSSEPIALGKGSWSPFNSQNTTWFKEAFPLLYIPSYCSFRMCDIWRSFVAIRICWANDWAVLFHEASVYQERNEHNLLRDFKDEVEGYVNNAAVCERLARLEIKSGSENIGENLMKCYESFVEMGLIDKKEMILLDDWLYDLKSYL